MLLPLMLFKDNILSINFNLHLIIGLSIKVKTQNPFTIFAICVKTKFVFAICAYPI